MAGKKPPRIKAIREVIKVWIKILLILYFSVLFASLHLNIWEFHNT